MKRFTAFGFSLSALLLCPSVWADEPVYCPEEVVCGQSGAVTSCMFEQHERGYWRDTVHASSPSSVLSGQYRLSYVSASYESRGPSYPICVYTHADVYNTVSLYAKPEANLARAASPDWRQEEFWWECKPLASSACPLFEEEAVYIENQRQAPITIVPGLIKIKPGQYTRLFADDFDDCGTRDACLVEIYTEEEQIGGLRLNLLDHMNIVDIFDNIDVKSEIIMMGDFNAVEVR